MEKEYGVGGTLTFNLCQLLCFVLFPSLIGYWSCTCATARGLATLPAMMATEMITEYVVMIPS